jgi:hypothetical protein
MKTTILFILLTFTCLGQSKDSIGARINWQTGKIEYIEPINIVATYEGGNIFTASTPGYISHIFFERLIEDYQAYTAECYADSFIVTEHITDTTPCDMFWYNNSSVCINPKHDNKLVYTHSEPTFTGFMEWLEKKYGRKE